jgi:acetyl esterase/lipase
LIELHEGGSVRSRVVGVGSRVVLRSVLGFWPVTGPLAPAMRLIDVAAKALPGHCSVSRTRVHGHGWSADLFRPQGVDRGDAAIVYFHGGAFLFAGTATHRRLAERLALETGHPVLSVAYRHLPETTVSGSVDDAVAAVNWMLDQGYDPSRLIVAGDSAGGHLAFVVARTAAEHGLRLGGLVAISPWLEFDNTERRLHRNAWRDLMIPTFRLDRIAQHVVGAAVVDPALSPLNQRVDDLPPTLLIASGSEVLLLDAEKMERQLDEAGVPVELHVWPGQVHCFPVLARILPESREAIYLMAEFVVAAVGRAESAVEAIIAS